VSCSEFGVRYQSCMVYKEFEIRCRNCVVCSELTFAAELCVLQWNCDSLPKLYCLYRICDSLPKLSYLQRISIRCWKRVCCREVAFTAEIVAPTTKLFSLPNWATCSEPVFTAEVRSLQWTYFRCRTVQPTASQFSLLISTIGLSVIYDSNA
jgi:hypothetical protein